MLDLSLRAILMIAITTGSSVGGVQAVDSGSAQSKASSNATSPNIDDDGWTLLFNGTDLSGWVQRNGTAKYEVVDGTIEGQTAIGSPNSFLCTEKDYADFELTFEVKVDQDLNSGVQIRSSSKKEVNNGRVFGPQIEIEAITADAKNPCEAGYVYSEGTGRGWISQNRMIGDAFKNDQWNRFTVRAVGPRIQTWVNGRKIEDLFDEQSHSAGFIGLQVHSIPNDVGPYKVRWRDLRIRELTQDSKQ